MAEIDPVTLRFIADTNRFEADVRKATRTVDEHLGRQEQRAKSFGGKFSGAMSIAKGAVVGFAAAVGVDAVAGAISRALDYASSLGEVAKQLGVSTDALQEYRFAATQAGLAQEEIDQALSQLTRRLGEAASGTKAQAEAFQTLGINVRDARGNILDAGDAIPLIADALKRVESPAARAALLLDLFGKSGQKLEPLLADGAAGVNNLRDAARELGIVLSSQQIQSADDAADKLAAVKQVLEARLAGVVADNAEEITMLADALANLADKALKAAAGMARFFKENSARGDFIRQTDKRLSATPGMTPAKREAAAGAALRDYDQRTGFDNYPIKPMGTTLMELFGGQTQKFSGGGLGSSGIERMLGGQVGQGDALRRLLGDGSAPAAQAMTANLNGMSVELQRLNADLAAATADLTGSIQDRAEAERQRIDADLAGEVERLKADKELGDAERDQRIAVLQQTAAVQKSAVANAASADLAEQRLRDEDRALGQRLDALRDDARTLEAQSRIALTLDARRKLEERILALMQEEERQRLEAAIAAGDVADAARARANLKAKQEADRAGLGLALASPLERYANDAKDSKQRVQEAAVRRIEELNQTIADAFTSALGVKDPFLSQLIKIFLDKNIFGPLAESLDGARGGGGILGAIGSLFGGIFGRASGGRVNAGQIYRINEGAGAGRVEAFRPDVGGQIIPLGRMNAVAQGGASQAAGVAVVRLELSGDIDARIDRRSAGVAVEVVRQSAPQIVDAAANETIRRANRPSL